MAQDRYLLNFTGTPPLPEADTALIRSKTKLIDVGRKTLLVEVNQAHVIDELMQELTSWTVQKESFYAIPTTRPNVRKPPKP